MPNCLWEIDAPYFNVGLVTVDGVVKHTAPLTRYMIGWSIQRVAKYCRTHKFKLTLIRGKSESV